MDLVGTTVGGKYRVLSKIGTGSMGDVYDAEHKGVHVALKVLKVEDESLAKRFLREAKTMSLFRHPNIVELLEVGTTDDGTLYFAAELVRGITLRQLIDGGERSGSARSEVAIDQKRSLAIVRQILEALGHAHAMGVVHRDIKPENVMLVDGGDLQSDLVKILDFGVAKLVGDTPAVLGEGTLTITGYGALGTPYYMSPEAVLGRALDARADLYSVGALLFELLTGTVPYTHDDVATLMRMHAGAEIPKLHDRAPDRGTTPELELVVSEALAKKPELRFKSAAEMIEAIDAATRSLEPMPAVIERVLDRGPGSDGERRGDVIGPEVETKKITDLFGVAPMKPPASGSVKLPGLPPAPGEPPPRETPIMAMPSLPEPQMFEASDGSSLFSLPKKEAMKLVARAKRHKKIVAIVGGAIVLIVIIAIVASSGKKSQQTATTDAKPATSTEPKPTSDLAQRARDQIASGHPARAVELIEREEIGNDADTYVVLGHARIGANRRLDGIAAYAQAIKLAPKLAADPQIRIDVARVLDTRDAPASIAALELAMKLDPPAQDLVKQTATVGKVGDARRWAYAIAEREKFAEGIDRVESWSLDLAQAANCEERLAAILKLRRVADPRAIPALKRARTYRCVEREVAEAIAYLESRPANP